MDLMKKISSKILNQQIYRFIIIGIAAASIHFLSVYIIVSTVDLIPIIANIFAFLIAFFVSYMGHSLWTFSHKEHEHHKAAVRYFGVAIFCFALNESGYYLMLEFTDFNYLVSLFIVLMLVPIVTFLLSKHWAFS